MFFRQQANIVRMSDLEAKLLTANVTATMQAILPRPGPPKKSSFMMQDIVGGAFELHRSAGSSTNLSPSTDRSTENFRSPQFPEIGTDSSLETGSSQSPEEPPLQQPKKNRSSFTTHQVYQLEKTFEHQQYLGTKERQQLALAVNMTDNQVKTWFQNRRMKHKRKRAELAQHHTKLAYLNSLSYGLPSIQPSSIHGCQPPVYPTYPGYPSAPQITYPGYPADFVGLHRSPRPPMYREFPGPEFRPSPSSPPPEYSGLHLSQPCRECPGSECSRDCAPPLSFPPNLPLFS